MAHRYLRRLTRRFRRVAAVALFLLAAFNAATSQMKTVGSIGNSFVSTLSADIHPLVPYLEWVQFAFPALLALMLARGTSITRCVAITLVVVVSVTALLIGTSTDEISLAMRPQW